MADTGSIFLDDIDDTPLKTQSKLLRVLESNEVRHIGGTKPIPVDVRLITASKMEIKDLVTQKMFRQDLYYSINIVQIRIPPLRERKADIPLLIDHLIKRLAPDKKLKISEDALKILMRYNWPGNVRELRNVVQRASLFADGEIKTADLPDDYRQIDYIDQLVTACHACLNLGEMPYNAVIQCLEARLLKDALDSTDGNQSEAARKLGMKLSTFWDKLKKLDVYQPDA